MHHFSILMTLAAAVCSVAAVPTGDSSEAVWAGVYNLTDTSIIEDSETPLKKRDECGAGNILVSKAGVNALISDLQNNNPDGLTYLPHGSGTNWARGDVRVCVDNTYVFENTHVKRWEVGWAMSYIRDMCCSTSGNPQCEGGRATAHGDSGLPIQVYFGSSSKPCLGLW
ncbi:hypothetical protein CSOJ01_11095 [Colletotrichum sojae]|uniref:Uncharacterized protein n=1 Tax=Colletotrichum sojae TaxID=2175907 RepID=A0A8H6MP70_9PEZI|nr:hypothetical protein CSOJ01_11095 [Colletotrichum sojae]